MIIVVAPSDNTIQYQTNGVKIRNAISCLFCNKSKCMDDPHTLMSVWINFSQTWYKYDLQSRKTQYPRGVGCQGVTK